MSTTLTDTKRRINATFVASLTKSAADVDRAFAWLFLGQWLFGVAIALLISPETWAGSERSTHPHLYAAVFLGGLIAALPMYLGFAQPGHAFNRYVNAVSQMLVSTLLVHLTGGRIETHFHIFGSLAFIAFYLDWKALALATVVTTFNHFLRGYYWPESVYGVLAASPWRSFEHAGWVLFEDAVLFYAITLRLRDLQSMSAKQVFLEISNSESRRAHQAAESYRYALDNFAMVSITGTDGKLTFANENFCRLARCEAQDLLGRSYEDLASPCVHSPEFFAAVRKKIAAGHIWSGEILNQAADGTFYWVDTNIVPIFDETGRLKEFLGIQKDISARKQLEEDLRVLNRSLEATVRERTDQVMAAESKLVHTSKLSSLGEMAGGVAHEINNPLGIIKLVGQQLADLLEEQPFDKQLASEMMTKLLKMTDRISRIVHGLRTFSRDGSRDPLEDVKVQEVIDDTLGLCSERIRNHGINLEVHAVDPALAIKARGTEIAQVLVNLVNNAADAIAGLPEKWIRLSASVGEEWVEIRVTDSGNGIPTEQASSIFRPFFTTKEVGKGTGLGLSISHGIARQHGGDLSIDETSPNTCFVMRIPRAGAKKKAA